MGTSKTEQFDAYQNELALMAKALSHPARVAILQLLLRSSACVCSDLVPELGLSQATVSQHLKELKQLGLIKGNTGPGKPCYCIDEQGWERLGQTLGGFLRTAYLAQGSCGL